MAENPDNNMYEGLTDEEGLGNCVPDKGMLRFVLRDETHLTGKRILQQYQWSQKEGRYGWFDIPMVKE